MVAAFLGMRNDLDWFLVYKANDLNGILSCVITSRSCFEHLSQG